MFADDTSIFVSQTINYDFTKMFDLVLLHTSKLFQAEQLT